MCQRGTGPWYTGGTPQAPALGALPTSRSQKGRPHQTPNEVALPRNLRRKTEARQAMPDKGVAFSIPLPAQVQAPFNLQQCESAAGGRVQFDEASRNGTVSCGFVSRRHHIYNRRATN